MSNAAQWRTSALDVLAHENLLGARNAARRALWLGEGLRQRVALNVDDAPIVPGLLSVVVPAYGVEAYIEETLDSLSRQDYRSIEIIVVDDGSPDRTRDIVRRYQRRDPRVKMVRKQNQGLGAARNTGIEHARGEFLAFLDSDDTVDRFVYREAVDSLRATGSDFAVTPYRRIVKGQLRSAAWWINEAHARYRPACTLDDFPAIMVNAVAWTKIYRREFWNRQGFSFPAGVLYEDQEVSTRAYAEASSFDVMPRIGLNWRIRDDRSSITQQVVSLRNIVDHWKAAEDSLAVLRDGQVPEAYRERLLQYLNFNMSEFLPQIRAMDDESWDAFRQAVSSLLAQLPPGSWQDVDARAKVMLTLVRQDDQAGALRFLQESGWDRHRFSGNVVGDQIIGNLPLRQNPSLPADAFHLSPEETKLVAILREAHADVEEGRFTLRVLAFIDGIDCERYPQDVEVTLVDERSGAEVRAAMSREPHPEDALRHTRPYADVGRQSWRASFDIAPLLSGRHWHILVTARVEGLERQRPLGFDARSPMVDPRWVVGDVRYSLLADEDGHLFLASTALDQLAVTSMRVADNAVDVHLVVDDGQVAELSWRDIDDRLSLPRGITPVQGRGQVSVRMALPRTLSDPEGLRQTFVLQARPGRGEWRTLPLRQVTADYDHASGWSVRPHWPSLQLATAGAYGERPVLPGAATLVRHRAAAIVDSIELVDDAIEIGGALLPAGAEADEAVLNVRSQRMPTSWQPTGDGRVVLRAPLHHDQWGLGTRSIPTGPQTIGAVTGDDAVGLDVEDALATAFPLEIYSPDLLLIYYRSDETELVANGHAPLPVGDRERGNSIRLREETAALTGVASRPMALFRSLYGEVANDSALATHERLLERGTDLDLVWAVRDGSVPVPPGGRPVLENSREYFEAFRQATYLMVNVHQPDWHERPEGQTIIETFHGYPFKQNGVTWWETLGFTPERIASFFRRAREWDYLVSPAAYATSPLLEFFPDRDPGPTRILEIGYPRNDVLFGERASALRADTRQRLGLRNDQIAVLYGPTFRDYASADDMTAAMVDFLDYQKIIDHFGDRVVILGRGHPFNARSGTELARHVLNVTDYPDINDLIVASDAAVLDYSSLRFDYALTRKPMIFLVPDREQYFAGRTGFIPYEPTAPGPWVDTTEEVIGFLENLEAANRAQAAERERFISTFMELEDGHATDRLLDEVFVPRGHAGGR